MGSVHQDNVALLNTTAAKCCAILRNDSRVLAVILVGSLARGDADICSDVDLCVVVHSGECLSDQFMRLKNRENG